jgi:hypothetical protein
LFDSCIVKKVGARPTKGQDQPAELIAICKRFNIKVKAKKLQKESKNLNGPISMRMSFGGRDAENLMKCYLELLAVVFPASIRAKDKDFEKSYKRCKEAFEAYALVWELLNDKVEDTQEARTQHASKVSHAFYCH